jgi:hypothetical protein
MEKSKFRGAGITASATNCARSVASAASSDFARKLPLPLPLHKQYRAQVLKTARSKRAAERRLDKALAVETGSAAEHTTRINALELSQTCSSQTTELRRDLPQTKRNVSWLSQRGDLRPD